jgi:tetratricopeptide (TPR) repeat protein
LRAAACGIGSGQLARDEADRKLALALEKVRLEKSDLTTERGFDHAKVVRAYDQVFGKAGLPVAVEGAAGLAEKIRRSPIREQLVAILDDWALAAWMFGRQALAGRLLALARQADPDPWRDQARNIILWQDLRALAKLAGGLKQDLKGRERGSQPSPEFYFLLGVLLSGHGAEGEGWLRQGQSAYQNDFWLNFQLGYTLLHNHQLEEAAGFFRAAIAVRPDSAVAHGNLALVLNDRKDLEGAIREYRRAIELDKNYAAAYTNLGTALREKGDLEGAIQADTRAIQLNPNLRRPITTWALL